MNLVAFQLGMFQRRRQADCLALLIDLLGDQKTLLLGMGKQLKLYATVEAALRAAAAL